MPNQHISLLSYACPSCSRKKPSAPCPLNRARQEMYQEAPPCTSAEWLAAGHASGIERGIAGHHERRERSPASMREATHGRDFPAVRILLPARSASTNAAPMTEIRPAWGSNASIVLALSLKLCSTWRVSLTDATLLVRRDHKPIPANMQSGFSSLPAQPCNSAVPFFPLLL